MTYIAQEITNSSDVINILNQMVANDFDNFNKLRKVPHSPLFFKEIADNRSGDGFLYSSQTTDSAYGEIVPTDPLVAEFIVPGDGYYLFTYNVGIPWEAAADGFPFFYIYDTYITLDLTTSLRDYQALCRYVTLRIDHSTFFGFMRPITIETIVWLHGGQKVSFAPGVISGLPGAAGGGPVAIPRSSSVFFSIERIEHV